MLKIAWKGQLAKILLSEMLSLESITSSALLRSGVASLLMLTDSVGLLLAGAGAAPLRLAEPRPGDLLPSDLGMGGGEGMMMSRGVGAGNHGCISPTARAVDIFTNRLVSLQ